MTWVQSFFRLDPNYLRAADDILKFIGFRQMMNIILLTLLQLVMDQVPETRVSGFGSTINHGESS